MHCLNLGLEEFADRPNDQPGACDPIENDRQRRQGVPPGVRGAVAVGVVQKQNVARNRLTDVGRDAFGGAGFFPVVAAPAPEHMSQFCLVHSRQEPKLNTPYGGR